MTKDHRDSNSLAWEELVKVEITKMKRTRRYALLKKWPALHVSY